MTINDQMDIPIVGTMTANNHQINVERISIQRRDVKPLANVVLMEDRRNK